MNHQGTKRIETKRLILRPFTMEDAPAMYKNWASDPEVTRYLTWKPYGSVTEAETVLKEWVTAYEKKDKYEWCLEWKETGEPIGSLGVTHIEEKVQAAEIGYCLGRFWWKQGLMTEACKAVVSYLLEEVGFRRIEARHDAKNTGSGQVLKNCGFIYEGTRIQADWNNGGICDAVLYGLVKDCNKKTETGKKEEEDSQRTAGKKHMISDETIEYVGILAKLKLSKKEREQAKKDMGNMLDYIDKLNELDTEGVVPMSHVFSSCNVFREDIVENEDNREAILKNAPARKDSSFQVPKTVEQEG